MFSNTYDKALSSKKTYHEFFQSFKTSGFYIEHQYSSGTEKPFEYVELKKNWRDYWA